MLRRIAVFGSLVLLLTSCAGDPEPERVELSQFIGMKSDDVESYLREHFDTVFIEVRPEDYSAAGRIMVSEGDNDEILAIDGEVFRPTADSLTVWTLRRSEARWYRKNPKMPKVKKGRDCSEIGDEKKIGPVYDLVFTVWDPRRKHPKGYEPLDESIQKEWPHPDAKRERKDFLALEADEYPSVVSGQYPKAGKPLRMGQLMAVFCRPGEEPPAEGEYNEVPIPDVPNDEEDDFDFPDKLCPTRFC